MRLRSLSTFALSILFAATLTASLGGCSYFDASFNVEKLNKAQATGSPFAKQLTDEYRNRANDSQENYNYEQADSVALRGLATADGNEVEPYHLDDWDLPQDKFEELATARQRLLAAFSKDAKNKTPTETAKAQANFDCWVEDAVKDWDAEKFKTCRQQFLQSIEDVESAVGKSPISAAAGMEGMGQDASIPDNASYYVFFNSGQNNLTAEGRKSIAAFVAEIKVRQPKQVLVNGYTDATGTKKSNQRISEKRAAAVAEALIKQGIPARTIKAQGRGETNPLVPSSKSEPSNRRVEVVIE